MTFTCLTTAHHQQPCDNLVYIRTRKRKNRSPFQSLTNYPNSSWARRKQTVSLNIFSRISTRDSTLRYNYDTPRSMSMLNGCSGRSTRVRRRAVFYICLRFADLAFSGLGLLLQARTISWEGASHDFEVSVSQSPARCPS